MGIALRLQDPEEELVESLDNVVRLDAYLPPSPTGDEPERLVRVLPLASLFAGVLWLVLAVAAYGAYVGVNG